MNIKYLMIFVFSEKQMSCPPPPPPTLPAAKPMCDNHLFSNSGDMVQANIGINMAVYGHQWPWKLGQIHHLGPFR